MHDQGALLFTLAAGVAVALAGGIAALRLNLPPIVGYLLAGVVVGPFTPGIVADSSIAAQLAEIGVILLMFGVGMHFSLRDLLSVGRIALPGAILQISFATAMGAAAAHWWGWTWASGIVLGLALSVASTVVLLRELSARELLNSLNGRIAVGWLIVEDLATVVMLVLMPALALSWNGQTNVSSGGLMAAMGLSAGKLIAFVALMLIAGVRVLPWLLDYVARLGSRELFTVAVIAIAVGIAVGAAELFGVSYALCAFFAGLVVRESDHSGRAASEMQPFQDAFTALFFVSVGMLFDPSIISAHAVHLAGAVAIVMIGKSLVAFAVVRIFRYPASTALVVAASLAQIGEFSFILGELGVALGLMPREGQSIIVAAALISITLNPFVFRGAAAIATRYVSDPSDA